MKSFKDYLTESVKIYEFKVKIAGECPKDCASKLKSALAQFHVQSCSAGKSTPIQERQSEFPEHKNVATTVFDVVTSYPATSLQVRDMVSERLGIPSANIRVRNLQEELEDEINHQHDKRTHKAVIGTDYEPSNHQDLVGDKRKMNFLQELNKDKKSMEQYTGVNDELFSKTGNSKKQPEMSTEAKAGKSVVGSSKVKLPDPMRGA